MGSTLLTIPPLALDFTGTITPAAFGVRNGHRIVKFKDAGNTEAFYSNFMPEGYVGANLSVTIAWMAESAIVGDVDWDVAFERLAAGGQDLDADGFAASVVSVSNTTTGDSGQLIYTTIIFTNPQADGLQPNEKFRIRIRRLGDNVTDDMVGDAQVTDVSINQVAFSGTLTVTEQDLSPSVTGVRTIKFANGQVIDEGGDTVSIAGGGGGGGFFADGVGVDSAIGQGTVTPPVAPGANSFASCDESRAGQGGTNDFAWGKRSFAQGAHSVAIGEDVGYNDFNLLNNQLEGPHFSLVQGKKIRVNAWQNGLLAQGYNILTSSDGYGRGGLYAIESYHQFVVGQNIILQHNSYYYSAGDYYGYAGPAFVWGDNHNVGTGLSYSTSKLVMVCMGYNNILTGEQGWVFGSNNTFQGSGSNTLSGQLNQFLFGHNNTVTCGTNPGNWHFLHDTTLTPGQDWFTWGTGHANNGGTGLGRRVLLAGRSHLLKGPGGGDEGTIFIWGRQGSNGSQLGNEKFFAWAVDPQAGSLGQTQHSFSINGRETTDATANQVLTTWHSDFTRGNHIRVEVTAYDRINNNQVAVFHADHIIAYRSAHTGVPILIPAGPIALTSVNSGGGSATWTARLVVNGTSGLQIQMTGAAATTIRWTGRIIILSAG